MIRGHITLIEPHQYNYGMNEKYSGGNRLRELCNLKKSPAVFYYDLYDLKEVIFH